MKYFSDIYKKETKACRQLFAKNRGCSWGQCESCGFIPLLYKLETGEILEEQNEIKELKDKILIN